MPTLSTRRTTHARRAATIAAGAGVLVLLVTSPASADGGWGQSDGNEIGAAVHFSSNSPGSGGSSMPPLSQNWDPAPCFYVPEYSPKEFEEFVQDHNYPGGSAGESMAGWYGPDEYNKGREGKWHKSVMNPAADQTGFYEQCGGENSYRFFGPADPVPPGVQVIDPEVLAGLAYNQMKLPAPPIELSPDPELQKVNFETHATFEKALDHVWVTAQFDGPGMEPIAATTVARPSKLRLEAGTDSAEPGACEYELKKDGGDYSVDTAGSDCNIKYTKSSRGETYNFTASITWEVTWTDSADPNGPAQEPDLPDGESVTEIPVTVKEVQTVTR